MFRNTLREFILPLVTLLLLAFTALAGPETIITPTGGKATFTSYARGTPTVKTPNWISLESTTTGNDNTTIIVHVTPTGTDVYRVGDPAQAWKHFRHAAYLARETDAIRAHIEDPAPAPALETSA